MENFRSKTRPFRDYSIEWDLVVCVEHVLSLTGCGAKEQFTKVGEHGREA